jgi:hypothetical protein
VVTFYRGGWCPYCNVQLRAYQQVLGEITRLGAKLVAISPQLPNGSMSTAEVNRLSFDVLGDIGNRVARSFGLVYSTAAGNAAARDLRRRARPQDRAPRSNSTTANGWSPTRSSRRPYAGRAGTGIDYAELEHLWRRLQPLAISKMPLDMAPPRDSRFGSPLTLSRVHWVRPELVAEVKYLSWTEDNLLRQVVYEGLREDKPAAEVRRAVPYPKPPEPARPASRSRRPRPG